MIRRVLCILLCLMVGQSVHAGIKNPEWWSYEIRGGVYQPTGSVMKQFFSGVSPVVAMSGGLLINSRYGIDLGIGFFKKSTTAIGVGSGTASQDSVSLLLLPMELEATYRFDYSDTQLVVPFVKAGGDAIYFRENDTGSIIQGVKYGLHSGGGLKLRLNRWMDRSLEVDEWTNDVFFVVDGRYRWVNDFGGNGLDLSGWSSTAGFHVQF